MPFPRKATLAVEILAVYVRVRWLLVRTDVPEVARRLRDTTGRVPSDRPGLGGVRLARAVTRTLRVLPTDSRCLTQSLVLLRLLARRGVEASVVIGVTTTPEFAAHAWVESGNVPLLPTLAPGFEPLVEL